MLSLLPFDQIWAMDFEFIAATGERQVPVCMVAQELRSGRRIMMWQDQLEAARGNPPFSTGNDAVFIAYYASAELQCFKVLDWPIPKRVIDLFPEFRIETNGLPLRQGAGLIGALAHFGIPSMSASEKDANRDLILRGGPWTEAEQFRMLAYCGDDVTALGKLLPAMLPRMMARTRSMHHDIGHALMRGRYSAAVAGMEWLGVPVDAELLGLMRSQWSDIKSRLISRIDAPYGCYQDGSFRSARFEKFLTANDIPWPRLESGALALDDDTFRSMAKGYPIISPLRELRHALSELRLNELAVGNDARNRAMLSMFRSRTGRNQPSNTRFIFGPAVWLRSLITPVPGTVLVSADFSAQEIAIAAALSGDERMMEGYASGDPYLSFAKQAGLVPSDATRATHKAARDRCKSVVLGTLYGMQAESMAARIGIARYEAAELIRLHRETYATFWRWVEANLVNFELTRRISTVFGWAMNAAPDWKPTALLNWPMQSNGAEMLRAACVSMSEAGIGVCAPVHDATLCEGPDSDPQGFAEGVRDHMRRAGRLICGGMEVRSDVKIIRAGDRYSDERGEGMWRTVMELIR